MQALRQWCSEHDIVLVCDEIQAAFGRTGKFFFGYQHYGIVPDLIALGKGISSSLPVSAVVGKKHLLDQYPPGSMTSTHTGNPICCVAALASIDIIERENLVRHAERVGETLQRELRKIADDFSQVVGACHGKGLVAGLHIVKPNTEEPNAPLALDIVRRSVEKGLLFFAPVGFGGATVKIAPPLVIDEEAILEGIGVLREAIAEALAQ
jgi:4-aminobutyrate aminotransferase-like enzyme